MRRLAVTCALLLFSTSAFGDEPCRRIISLAPSVTETVFALGLGGNVIAVDRFSHYPPETEKLPRVGGFLDPNFEAVSRLSPTAVIYLYEYRERADELRKLGLTTLMLDQRTVRGIEDSVSQLGRFCGAEKQADRLRTDLERSVSEVKAKTALLKPIRTLVVVGGEEIGSIKNLYVSGNDGFYDALLSAAGGQNVVTGETKSVTALSLEAIVGLNPDVILEVHPEALDLTGAESKIRHAWSVFPSIPAVRDNRIYLLRGDYAVIPGPRFPKLLRTIASLLHPELFSADRESP